MYEVNNILIHYMWETNNTGKYNSPAENTKNEVHDEECTQDDHGHKKYPLPAVTHGICNLRREGQE